jgi:hypothetical protein
VDPDPHPDLHTFRPGRSTVVVLHRNRGGDGVLCPRKRDEERLALRVDLMPAVITDCVADELVMTRE